MLLTELETGEYIITYFHDGEVVCEKEAINYTDGAKRAEEWRAEDPLNNAILTRILYNAENNYQRWQVKKKKEDDSE